MNTPLVPSDSSEPSPSESIRSKASRSDTGPSETNRSGSGLFGSTPLARIQHEHAGSAEAAQQDLFDFLADPREGAPALAPDVPSEVVAPVMPGGKGGGSDNRDASCEEAARSAVAALDEVAQANLRRLEETLNWLQGEAQACRLPRAAQLPPVEGLPVMEAMIDRTTLQRTLQRAAPVPAWLTTHEDMPSLSLLQRGGGAWRRVVKFLSACAVAAPTAYLFAVATSPQHRILDDLADITPRISARLPSVELKSQTGAARVSFAVPEATAEAAGLVPSGPPPLRTPPLATAIHSRAAGQAVQAAIEPRADTPPDEVVTDAPTTPVSPSAAGAGAATSGTHAAVAETAGAPPSSAAQPRLEQADPGRAAADHEGSATLTTGIGGEPEKPAGSIDARPSHKAATPQEITVWIDQGRQFFDAGDLVAARILFQRAANAGDSAAAVAMGATYDPVILNGRGVRGVTGDLEKARGWYERAREMGSPEGPRRLEMLANR